MRLAPLAALILAAALASGCSVFDRDHDDRASSARTASGTVRPAGIPDSARRVASDTGELSYSAPRPGTAYVVDDESGRLLVAQQLDTGERLRVLPADDRIRVNDRTVFSKNLESKHRHAVYFLPNSTSDAMRN